MAPRRILSYAFAAVLSFSGTALAQISADAAIGLIDDLPASRLDPALPKDPFLSWLKDLLGASAKIEWEMNDCGTLTGVPWIDEERDIPVCMEANVMLTDQRMLGIAVFVGTEKKGLTKSPRVANIYIETDGDVAYFKSLSELEAALKAVVKK
jgi:hypothetical protein